MAVTTGIDGGRGGGGGVDPDGFEHPANKATARRTGSRNAGFTQKPFLHMIYSFPKKGATGNFNHEPERTEEDNIAKIEAVKARVRVCS
jgi:hypothetical protein